ncbi:MAG: TolC family protein [Comamonadaceae bacterium]|nr:TolC family protein [Comamonadaceae bacterium]
MIAEPQPLTQDRPYWQEQILAHSHELALARAQVQRERLVAARSGADRLPDPTAGIHYASEFGGRERIVGVSVSIPLPGAAAPRASDGAQARAEAAASREAGIAAQAGGGDRRHLRRGPVRLRQLAQSARCRRSASTPAQT